MGCCCAKCYGDEDDDTRARLIPSGTAGYQSLGKTSIDSKLEVFDHSSVKVESVDNQFKQLTTDHNALISDWNKLEEARNNLTKEQKVEQNLDKVFHHWRDRNELPQVQIDHPNGNLTLINYSLEQITKEQQEMLDHFNKLSRMSDKLMKTCPKLMQDMDTVLQDKISIEDKVSTGVSEEQQDKSLSNLKTIFENLNIMRLNIEQVKAHTMMTCDRLRNAARVLQEAKAESREARDEHPGAAAAVSESDGESGIEMRSERSDVEGTKDAAPIPLIPPSEDATKPDEDTPVGAPSPYSLNFDQQTSQEDQVDKGDAVDAVTQKPADTGQDTSESGGEHGDQVLAHSPASTTSGSSTEKAPSETSSSSHHSDSSSGRHYTSTEEESIKGETGSEGRSPQDQDAVPREEEEGRIRDETAHPGDERHDDSVTDIDTEHADSTAKEPDHETSADETLPTDQSRSDDTILSADITDVTDITGTSETLDVTTGDEKSDEVPDSRTDAENVDQQSTEETHEGQKPPAEEKASDSREGDDRDGDGDKGE